MINVIKKASVDFRENNTNKDISVPIKNIYIHAHTYNIYIYIYMTP